MGFRFRKSVKLFPGVKLNFSMTGVSASVVRPGATVNVSSRGAKATVGIPGTGISYSENIPSQAARSSEGFPFARQRPPVDGERLSGTKGMGFGALLGWGLVALIGFLMISGLFK